MTDSNGTDRTRRDFLMAAGQGLMAAGVAQAAAPGGDVPLAPPDAQPPKLPVPEGPAPKKLGWAVVGLGQLALEEVMPAFAESQKARPVALVSGHRDKAQKVAERYGIDPKKVYGYAGFDRIADDPAVDVVYIILPNSRHAEFTVRAHQAGKHVLCEKPMAPTGEECARMTAAARQAGKTLMIANRLRYEPHHQAVFDMAHRGAYGPVRLIEASNVQNVQAPNIRLSRKTGGGPVGDVGVYCVQTARWVTAELPAEVFAWAHSAPDDPRFREVPDRVGFTLRFPSGVVAQCGVSFSAETSRRYRVSCADGWIEMDPAYDYRGLRLHVGTEKMRQELKLRDVNQFAAEMDHLCECVAKNETPWTPGEDGLIDVTIVKAIEESARTGTPVEPNFSVPSRA